MQTQELNDEQSPDSVHSRVMGRSNSVQTDWSSSKPADSLSMPDLQEISLNEQSVLEQGNNLKPSTDTFDSELEDLRKWEEKERRLDEAFDKALERMKTLEDRQTLVEKQQHDFTVR